MNKSCDSTEMTTGKKVLFAGCLAHLIHDGFSDMLYIFFPIWQVQFSLTFAEIGLLKTLFSGSLAGFQVPAGYLASRMGEVKLLLLGTILTSAAVFLLGWAAAPIMVGCLLVIGGLGSSTQHPLSSSLISSAYPDKAERRTALSTFNVAGDFGKLLLPGMTALLITQYDWMTASHVLGILGMISVIVIFLITKNIRQQSSSNEGKTKTAALGCFAWKGNQSFWSLSMIGVIDSATRMGFLTFFPFLLQEKGAQVSLIGLALSLVFAGGAAGKYICGKLATRFGILRTVVTTEMVTTLCILGILLLPLEPVLLLAPILGIALNGTSSVLYGSVPELVSEEQCKQAFAIFYTATIGSGAISPFLYGLASDMVGVNIAVVLIAFVVLLTLPLTLPLRGKFA
ncbi:MFS transporter [Pelosinus propionicus]|uniref:Major Facilitator Superfamily protein n=1 Tax=Pelosinus propionicus DSM 13327 TaxID=1123291 RepID=A0A1I4IQH2_9FIRM|nr:MFS transporter [Pelosinus propionicus]SFL56233.1 Major Facilitator Superfamily protein [Pelosinus propionicus DSM 13327]